ncbi:lipooligosaccharide biosynthesis protein LpsA (plasmid) [Methylomagnum ishizawai]|nr:lipooligosaccharide biosynthesis protein LpsA [Methylomagnum ishizawai]
MVNLARSSERRAHIHRHLQALGLPFEIVPAIDGATLGPADLATVYDPRQAVASLGRELTPGEIGCALSHLRLYRRMVDEDIEAALILEDDAQPGPALCRLLAARADLPDDWEVVMLYHVDGQLSRWGRRHWVPGYRIGRFAHPAFSTLGYLVRRGAALKLLAQTLPLRAPIDHWTGGSLAAGLRLYGVDPLGIREAAPEDTGGSIIAADRERYWKQWGLPELPAGLGLYLYRLKVWMIKRYRKYHPGKRL